MVKFRFPVGQIVATPAALKAIESAGVVVFDLLLRHGAGDWGDVCADDAEENERSVAQGFRILSSYTLVDGGNSLEQCRIWIITEADRSMTTVLLPSEY